MCSFLHASLDSVVKPVEALRSLTGPVAMPDLVPPGDHRVSCLFALSIIVLSGAPVLPRGELVLSDLGEAVHGEVLPAMPGPMLLSAALFMLPIITIDPCKALITVLSALPDFAGISLSHINLIQININILI